jgi:hypothetical protein
MAISPQRLLVLGPREGTPLANTIADAPDPMAVQFGALVRSTARRYLYRTPVAPLDLPERRAPERD